MDPYIRILVPIIRHVNIGLQPDKHTAAIRSCTILISFGILLDLISHSLHKRRPVLVVLMPHHNPAQVDPVSGGRRHVDIGKDAQLVAVGHLELVNRSRAHV